MRYDTLCCTFASYNANTYNEDEIFTCAFVNFCLPRENQSHITSSIGEGVAAEAWWSSTEVLRSGPALRSFHLDVWNSSCT